MQGSKQKSGHQNYQEVVNLTKKANQMIRLLYLSKYFNLSDTEQLLLPVQEGSDALPIEARVFFL